MATTIPPEGPYRDLIYNGNDVCRNCLRLVRRERIDPVRGTVGVEYEESLERDPRTTVVAFGPGESISDHKGVFCECGCEGVFTDWRDETDVDREKFKELATNLIRTLDAKGVTVNREETVGMAFERWRDGDPIDEAFARGVDHGLAVATRRGTDDERQTETE